MVVAPPASEAPVDLTDRATNDPAKDELPADAAALVAKLGDPGMGNSHGWVYIRWQHKQLEVPEIRLLGKHAFMPRPLNKKLNTLDLTGSVTARDADWSHVGVSVLVDALAAGAFGVLKELTLSENKINDADGLRLLGALADADCLEEFATLKLEKNELGDATAKRLASGELPTLSALYINDNLIGDEGALAIAAGAWPRLDRLFMQNNLFTDEAVEALGRACAEPESTLRNTHYIVLDSYHFRLPELRNKETIVRIGGAITKLDLAGVEDQGRAREKMSSNDLAFLCHFLRQPARMVKLDLLLLHENAIGAAGCAALAGAMVDAASDAMRSLGQLHLTGNPLGDMGCKQLMAPYFQAADAGSMPLPNLRELHLGRCELGDKAAAAIGRAIATPGSFAELTLLSLGQNKIGDEGCASLAEALAANGAAPKLVGLYLGRNQIADGGARALASTLATTKNGIALHAVPCVPSLRQVHLFGNPGITAVGRAAMDGASTARGGGKYPAVTVDFE